MYRGNDLTSHWTTAPACGHACLQLSIQFDGMHCWARSKKSPILCKPGAQTCSNKISHKCKHACKPPHMYRCSLCTYLTSGTASTCCAARPPYLTLCYWSCGLDTGQTLDRDIRGHLWFVLPHRLWTFLRTRSPGVQRAGAYWALSWPLNEPPWQSSLVIAGKTCKNRGP